MFASHLGELAAFATAICWTVSSISFEYAGKKVGSMPVTYVRLLIAFVFISAYTFVTRGMFLPMDATSDNWIWLTVSGVIGFVLGDYFLFKAYVEIGARVSMLIMASVPILSAISDYLIMGEKLTLLDMTGMVVTIGGIAMVVLMKGAGDRKLTFSHPVKGITYAFFGALGQALGLVFSKFGMGSYDAFASTQIRLIAAIICFTIIVTVSKGWPKISQSIKNISAMKYLTVGAIFGPFIGVALSLLSVQLAPTGVASTIMSISRILIIPAAIFVFHEKVTKKEVLGALISIIGVAILFI